MSFILDALRKSDAERQRQSAPGLADIRYARPRARRSPWVPLLVVVLMGNLAFMAFQWWRSAAPAVAPTAVPGAMTAPAAVPAAPVVAAPAPAVPAPPAARAVPPPPEVRPLAGEADPAAVAGLPLPPDAVDDPDMAGIDDGLAAAAGIEPAGLADDAEAMAAAAAPAPAGTSRIREEAGLPTSQQLIAAGTLRVTDLSLELHVYSEDPARRFVIINGSRYREGSTLSEGPVVEAITSEGAVLDSQGTRFIVLPK